MLQTLTFDGARVINAEASFFRYESGSAGGADESIKVRADGQDLGLYFPGDSVELPDRRSMWELVPTTATCRGVVRVGVGRVQSARLSGSVRVIDEFTDSMQVYAFLPGVAVQAFNSTAVVLPATNVRGIMVRWAKANAQPGAAGVAFAQFVAAKSAPTGYTVPLQRYPLINAFSNNSATLVDLTQTYNKFIPPGWGLYASAEVTGAAAASCGGQIGFELL